MKKWWIPYQHITCMKQVDRIPHPTRQLHMIKSLKKGPTYSTTNVESCWNNNNSSSKDTTNHTSNFTTFITCASLNIFYLLRPTIIHRPPAHSCTSCETGYLNGLWVHIKTNNNRVSRNIIIIGWERAQNWWPSRIIIATLNDGYALQTNQTAQISKLQRNPTRKTHYFIYYFIFVPNAKQSAWVYSAKKS